MSHRTTRLWGIPTSDYPATRPNSGAPLRRLLIRDSLHSIIVDQLSRLLQSRVCTHVLLSFQHCRKRKASIPPASSNKVVYCSLASMFLVGSRKSHTHIITSVDSPVFIGYWLIFAQSGYVAAHHARVLYPQWEQCFRLEHNTPDGPIESIINNQGTCVFSKASSSSSWAANNRF
jgi:hypothetical protein